MKVRYSYLPQQFENADELWQQLKDFVATGTHSASLCRNLKQNFASLMGAKYAIGVNSGTDAIKLALKIRGIGPGDEVITAANTFVATVNASRTRAKPVFVDCDDTFCMDVNLVEAAITKKTRAIVPVHFTGYMTLHANNYGDSKPTQSCVVVEDACQSILGEVNGKKSGTWASTGAFSLHPLKNLNVWSDGGIIITSDEKLRDLLYLQRNHGLSDRDTVSVLGCNSRLDTLQAVVVGTQRFSS